MCIEKKIKKKENKEYYLCKHLFVLSTFIFQTVTLHYSISGYCLIDEKDSCVNLNVLFYFISSRSRHKSAPLARLFWADVYFQDQHFN